MNLSENLWKLQKQKDANIPRGQNWARPQHCNTTDAHKPDRFVKLSQQDFIQQKSFSSFASNRLKCLFDADVSHWTLRYYISTKLERYLVPEPPSRPQSVSGDTSFLFLPEAAARGAPLCATPLNSEPLLEKMSLWPWIKVLEWFASNLSHTICHRPV